MISLRSDWSHIISHTISTIAWYSYSTLQYGITLCFLELPSDKVTSDVCEITYSRFVVTHVTNIPNIWVGFDTKMVMASIDKSSPWGLLDVC